MKKSSKSKLKPTTPVVVIFGENNVASLSFAKSLSVAEIQRRIRSKFPRVLRAEIGNDLYLFKKRSVQLVPRVEEVV